MDPVIDPCPVVSVVMPVYNAEKYVRQAIVSILRQTFTCFEFLIYNDGSTDNSLEIIKSFKDDRIKIFQSDTNQGHLVHLNKGFEIASGEFIARMDADDISFPERLERQVDFLKNNPAVGVCGSWIKSFGDSNQITRFPQFNDEIKVNLLSHNTFAHPAVMIRKAVLAQNGVKYCKDFTTSQDYKMWVDLVPVTRFYNIPQVLLKYRLTEDQISRKLNHFQREFSKRVWLSQLKYVGIDPSEAEEELHINMLENNINNADELKRTDIWLNKLNEANRNSGFYNQIAFSDFIKKMKYDNIRSYVYNNFYQNKNKTMTLVKEFVFSDSRFYKYLSLPQMIKFIGKLVLKK